MCKNKTVKKERNTQIKNTIGRNLFRANLYLPWWQEHMVRCQNAQLSPPGSVLHLHPKPASHHPIKPTMGWLSWDPSEYQLSDNDIDNRTTYFLELTDGYRHNLH